MSARQPASVWRKATRSMANGACVEVAAVATCVREGCDEDATTVRHDVELCVFCAAERDMLAVATAVGVERDMLAIAQAVGVTR